MACQTRQLGCVKCVRHGGWEASDKSAPSVNFFSGKLLASVILVPTLVACQLWRLGCFNLSSSTHEATCTRIDPLAICSQRSSRVHLVQNTRTHIVQLYILGDHECRMMHACMKLRAPTAAPTHLADAEAGRVHLLQLGRHACRKVHANPMRTLWPAHACLYTHLVADVVAGAHLLQGMHAHAHLKSSTHEEHMHPHRPHTPCSRRSSRRGRP